MKVMLDLRPPHIVAIQKKRVDPIRLIVAALFFVFVVLSSINIASMLFSLTELEQALREAQDSKQSAEAMMVSLESQITQLRDEAQSFRDYLTFTNADIPVVEVLTALEAVTPARLKIETFTLNPGSASMVGVGVKDEDVVEFAQNLGQIPGIVTRVNVPITSKRTIGNSIASEFTLTLNVNELGTIFANAARSADLQGGTPEESQP